MIDDADEPMRQRLITETVVDLYAEDFHQADNIEERGSDSLSSYKVCILIAFLQLTNAVSTACEHQGGQISFITTQLLTLPGKQFSISTAAMQL